MTQTYFSYAEPAIEAGARPCGTWRNMWHGPDDRRYDSAIDFLRENEIEPKRIEPPKTKTITVIKRESEKRAQSAMKSNVLSGKDRAAVRAYQYAMTMTGTETTHSIGLSFLLTCVKFDTNSEGKSVPRYVDLGDEKPYEIPHWDFVPDEPVMVYEFPKYRAPAHLYSSASPWSMAA